MPDPHLSCKTPRRGSAGFGGEGIAIHDHARKLTEGGNMLTHVATEHENMGMQKILHSDGQNPQNCG